MTDPVMTEIQDLVDKMAGIQKELDDLGITDLLKEQDAIKKTLSAYAKEFDPDEAVTFAGKVGRVTFSKAPTNRTVVKLRELNETLGDKAFYQVAKVTVSTLKKWLPDREIEAFCEESYGSRRMSKVEY